MDIFNALTLTGGLSLFLFGMSIMGQALERRAGGKLRALLGKFTTGRAAGLLTGVLAIAIFGLAVITMKTSWRVGIPEEKTELITSGIYQWSRNPAFVGFDLLYLSMCLLFFNIPLLVISLWAAVMLHLQILQEEEHMRRMFGGGYILYTERTSRYLGRR